tara:strand:+ start:1203 stop:1466 length:264 start_codon:yes stop_codon:yes gene_type:complete
LGITKIKMNFIQKKDGSCTLHFSKEEIKIIQNKKSIHFTAEGLRHFGNVLMKIIIDFNENFNTETKNIITESTSKIKGIDKDDSENK